MSKRGVFSVVSPSRHRISLRILISGELAFLESTACYAALLNVSPENYHVGLVYSLEIMLPGNGNFL